MWTQRVPYKPISVWACEHVNTEGDLYNNTMWACGHVNTEGALYTNMSVSLWACEHIGCPIYANMCVISLWACEYRGCCIYQYVCEFVSMWTRRVPYIPTCVRACEHVNTEGALYIPICVRACACMNMWTQRVRPCINITPLCVWACEHVNTLRGCPSYITNYVFELVCIQTLTWIMWLTVFCLVCI